MLKNNIIEFLKTEYNIDSLNEFQREITLEEKGQIYGVIVFTHFYEVIDIDYLLIKEGYRNIGYGDLLVKSLIKYAQENNVSKITLEVNENNTSAIKLYKKNKFYQVSVRKNYYKNEDGLLMVLDL